MKEEYENCEDYWAGKLKDERECYDAQERSMEERFQRLQEEFQVKIQEYETLMMTEKSSCTLPTITEVSGEKQVSQNSNIFSYHTSMHLLVKLSSVIQLKTIRRHQ